MHGGPPGTWEGLIISAFNSGWAPGDQAQDPGRSAPLTWERRASADAVPPNEGDEVRWDGGQGIGAPHSTCEAGEPAPGDPVEGRGCRTTEPWEGKMPETPSSPCISTKLARIAELAKRAPGMAFTTLAHHIDVDWLREAYHRTRKDGAVGVDEQTASEYAVDLEANLESLLQRAKSGSYHAPPVRRVWIPKANGKQMRPIGIPTFEDKVLQRAVAMVLEAVYEQDFLDCSYGFRPKRSAHKALDALWHQLMASARWLADRAGHPRLLRESGPWKAASDSSSTDTRWRAAAIDWQMVARWGDGRG